MHHKTVWYRVVETVGAVITCLRTGPDAALVHKLGEEFSHMKGEGELQYGKIKLFLSVIN
jgi:hypothetical protein